MSKLWKYLAGGVFLCSGIFFLGSCEIPILIVSRTSYDMSKVSFNDSSFTYDGEEHSIFISGDLPSGVSVSYQGNQKVNAGEYKVTAKFTGAAESYTPISDLTANMTIAKASISGISFVGKSFVYDGQPHSLAIGGTLPEGVTVSYAYNSMTEAGTYSVVASFTDTTGNYDKLPDMTATMTISKADYDMSKVTFDSASYVYDGTEKRIEIKGTLPSGVSVSYKDNVLTDAGELTAVASFSHSNKNYNDIPDKTATLTVFKSSLSGISFSGSTLTYDGTAHSIFVDGTLPSGVTVSYTNNGQTDAGTYEVTAHFTDSTGNYQVLDDLTAELVINKASYDMSGVSFKDTHYTYDGTEKTLEISGSLPDGVTVSYTTNKMTDAGTLSVTASFSGDTINHNAIDSMVAVLSVGRQKLSAPSITYDGDWIEWTNVTSADYYIVTINGDDTKTTDNYLEMPATDKAIEFIVTCKAYSNSPANYLDSDSSNTLHRFGDITNIKVVDGVITWDAIEEVEEYMLTINGSNVLVTSNSYAFADEAAGDMTVKIYAKGKDDTKSTFDGNASAVLTLTKITAPVITYANGIISWAAVDHATGYNLYINGVKVPNGTSTSYVIPIDGNASYSIVVEASGDNTYLSSKSTYSDVSSVGSSSLAVSGDGVSWKAVSDATGYILVVNGTSHCFDATVTSYSLSGQASGDYELQLVAVSNKVTSFSYSAGAKKTITKLAAVTNIAASNGSLTWKAVANASSYKITIGTSVYTSSTDSLDLGEIAETGANDISVKAIEGTSYINADDSAKVNLIVLGSVANVSISEGYFTWDAVENASGYEVEINGIVYEVSVNLYKITGGGTYAFRVRAIGSGTYLSSPYISIKTYTKLSVPANVKVSSGKLVWDAVKGTKSYIVNINDVDYTSASNSFLVPSGVTANLLSIKVKAAGDNALVISSEYSAAQSFRKVAQSVISVTGGNTVSWTNTTELSVTSYTVSIGGTGGSSTNSGKANTYTIPDEDILALSNGEHTITLIAVGSDDRLSSCTDITVNLIGQVSNVVVSDSNVITWDKADGATSYEVTVNGTVSTVAQSDAPSYGLGSNALSSLTSIRALGDNSLSVAWTHFTVSIYKSGALYDTETVNPGDCASNTFKGKGGYLYYDSSFSNILDETKAVKRDGSLYLGWYKLDTSGTTKYIYYGLYPQTVVTDSALVTALSALTTTNSHGYYEYQGYMYDKIYANYRNDGYKFSDNTTVISSGTTYYFRVEPIKWRILKTSSGSYTLMSEQALGNEIFHPRRENNYANSHIRYWLNVGFLNRAFYLDSSLIKTTTVDNSASSTGYSSNPYACANTNDKVWLLSYAEARSSSYGFSTSENVNDTKRYCVPSDYARACGCEMSTSTSFYGYCGWWLRSPDPYNIERACYVYYVGSISGHDYVSNSYSGVRPALTISLS